MSIYLKQIEQLVALQKVDNKIYDLDKELEKAPAEVAELKKALEIVDKERERLNDKFTHLNDQAKRLDLTIGDEDGRLQKSKSKLMQVDNEKAYNAAMNEVDSMEKSNRGREDEKSMLQEELNRQGADLDEINAKHDTLSAELKEKETGLQGTIERCNKELSALQLKRKSTGCEVPAPILQRYEFIKGRLDHPVIVSIKNGICSGCNIAIPPQAFIELQKGTQILSCPNCQRLMYWCEHFQNV